MNSFEAGLTLTVIELFGDVAAKKQQLYMCLTSYLALGYSLFIFLKDKPLSLVNSNWDGISNIATLIIGIQMGERLTSTQLIGSVMISIGLFLIN